MIAYFKFFDLIARRGIRPKDLDAAGVASFSSLSKMRGNKVMQTQVIDHICAYLDVQPGDIMEYIPDKVQGKDE